MASPGQLVKVLADVLGVPEPTLTQHDRNLAVNGLRSMGGRGRSAAKVTARDAARLLVAIMGSNHVKDTVETVLRYESAQARKSAGTEGENSFCKFSVPELASLPDPHGFVDGLEALIASFISGTIFDDAQPGWFIQNTIEVLVAAPTTEGRIRVSSRSKGGKGAQVHYGIWTPFDQYYPDEPPKEVLKYWRDSFGDRTTMDDPDLKQVRTITAKTFFALGKVLKS